MYKIDKNDLGQNYNKQASSKSRLRQSSKQIIKQKQNDSKHLNSIKPYVNKQKQRQRKHSKKQIKAHNNLINSPYQMTRSKSKKLQASHRKIQQSNSIIIGNISNHNILPTNLLFVNNNNLSALHANVSNQKQINQHHQQIITLKTQIKQLKNSYNSILKEKNQISLRQEKIINQFQIKQKNLLEQLEKLKKSNIFLQSQIDRIKKQCFKILESQKFKYKKLQQTLQQKELMIAYLRTQNQNIKKKTIHNGSSSNLNCSSQQQNLQKLFFLQNSAPIFSYQSYAKLSVNTSVINNSCQNNVLIQQPQKPPNVNIRQKQKKHSSFYMHRHKKSQFEQDSLSFSRDRSKQFDSVHSLLSNNNDQSMLSVTQQQPIITFTKKDRIVLNQSLSLDESSLLNQDLNVQKYKQKQKQVKQNYQCLTFQNRILKYNEEYKLKSGKFLKNQTNNKHQNIRQSKQILQTKKSKNNYQNTKRLQIITDQFNTNQKLNQDQDIFSIENKKKTSKSKGKCTSQSVIQQNTKKSIKKKQKQK